MGMSEQEKAERAKQDAQQKVDFEAIVDEINKLGYEAKLVENTNTWGTMWKVSVEDGFDPYIEYNYQSSGDIWRRRRGAPYITVGDYGSKKVFRCKKVGGFNYETIATEAMQDARQRKARNDEYDRQRNARDTNKDAAEAFKEKNQTVGTGFYVCASTDLEHPLSVEWDWKKNLTVEEAQRIFDILKNNNLLR